MPKIFVHHREHPDSEFINSEIEYASVPAVGEYLITNTTGEWHRVYAVVHCPSGRTNDAEVYTSPISRDERHSVILQRMA